MDTCTKCILNGPKMYPLERQLRIIAKADGSYVMCMFDCCRDMIKNATKRGDGDGDDFDMDEGISHQNFVGTFGCQPSDGVAQKSTIAKGYFRCLRMMAKQNKVGQIKLPEAIQLFKGTDKKCETLCAVEQNIYLEWHDKVTPDDGCDEYFNVVKT